MTNYLYTNQIKIFNYQKFCEPLTKRIRNTAEAIAHEAGIEKNSSAKQRHIEKMINDRIQDPIESKQSTEGLVQVFSTMENCNIYKPWHEKRAEGPSRNLAAVNAFTTTSISLIMILDYAI